MLGDVHLLKTCLHWPNVAPDLQNGEHPLPDKPLGGKRVEFSRRSFARITVNDNGRVSQCDPTPSTRHGHHHACMVTDTVTVMPTSWWQTRRRQCHRHSSVYSIGLTLHSRSDCTCFRLQARTTACQRIPCLPTLPGMWFIWLFGDQVQYQYLVSVLSTLYPWRCLWHWQVSISLLTSRRLLVRSFVSVFCVENTHLFRTRSSQIGCEEVMLQTLLQRSCDSFGHREHVDITVENTVTICIYCLVNVRRVCQQFGWCCL